VQEADLQLGVSPVRKSADTVAARAAEEVVTSPANIIIYCDEVPYAAGVLAEGHAATLRRTGPASATVG
jgi:hypothetical protein